MFFTIKNKVAPLETKKITNHGIQTWVTFLLAILKDFYPPKCSEID